MVVVVLGTDSCDISSSCGSASFSLLAVELFWQIMSYPSAVSAQNWNIWMH